MYESNTPLTASLHKRQKVMRDIQNILRDNFKQRARSQLVSHLTQEQLNTLIQSTNNSINQQQLTTLVKYANDQFSNAVAHLGNLVLDCVVKVSQLQKYTLKPGYHPYWLWFIEVLVEKEYCTLNLVDHCIKAISPQRSSKTVKSALSILYKITVSSNLHSPLLLRDEQTILSILHACSRTDSSSDIGYLLVYQLLVKNEGQFQYKFIEGKLRNEIVNVLIQGSLSVVKRRKLITCKILCEFVKKNIFFGQMAQTVLVLMYQAPSFDGCQTLLDFLLLLIQKSSDKQLLTLIDLDLIIQLSLWKKHFQFNQDHQNLCILTTIARELDQKTKDIPNIGRGIRNQLQRFYLLGISYTIDFC